MHSNILIYAIIYPVAGIALVSVIFTTLGRRLPSSWLWSIAVAGVLASVVRLIHLSGTAVWGFDHHIFWKVGNDVWAGMDPYSPERFRTHPFLNPPSTFAFFGLIAALPYRASLFLWTFIYTFISYALVFMGRAVLDTDDGGEAQPLSYAELGALATTVALSDACMATLELGQLALMGTALILLALYARARNRPIIAGVTMGLATMKVATMLPFLLLFHRKKDLKTWFAIGATVVVLVLLGGQPSRLLDQCRGMLHYIGEFSRPGAVNDISYDGPYNEGIMGFDHLAYRLGVRQASSLKAIQYGAVLLVGSWLAVELVTRRVSWGLGVSLVSLYSVVFLYHRVYDAVMIVPALVYAIGRAKATSGRAHWLYVVATVLMLLLLYQRRKTLAQVTHWVVEHRGVASRLVECFVLPYATWSILLAMICLRLAYVVSRDPGPLDPAGRVQALSHLA